MVWKIITHCRKLDRVQYCGEFWFLAGDCRIEWTADSYRTSLIVGQNSTNGIKLGFRRGITAVIGM
jgi:hypothetical protein